jgi:glycosyltransferase involved in cell wall biosynthesis
MKIGLWTLTPNRVVGCKKVIDNLKKGLDQLEQEYVENELGDVNGCIHGGVKEFKEKTLPSNTLIGPEIVVLPSETNSWIKYKNWCQPSQWVIDYMKVFREVKYNRLYVWPVGIDTDEFQPDRDKMKKYDCFIYYKNVTRQTPIEKLNYVRRELDNRKMTYKVIEYGKYTEDELKKACSDCLFAVFLTGTESQGIALMEVMSMDCPVFVINEPVFKYSNFEFYGASSAPYFDNRCGMIAKDICEIGDFRDELLKYYPRDYIIENHTCVKGAEKYINLLRKCYENH